MQYKFLEDDDPFTNLHFLPCLHVNFKKSQTHKHPQTAHQLSPEIQKHQKKRVTKGPHEIPRSTDQRHSRHPVSHESQVGCATSNKPFGPLLEGSGLKPSSPVSQSNWLMLCRQICQPLQSPHITHSRWDFQGKSTWDLTYPQDLNHSCELLKHCPYHLSRKATPRLAGFVFFDPSQKKLPAKEKKKNGHPSTHRALKLNDLAEDLRSKKGPCRVLVFRFPFFGVVCFVLFLFCVFFLCFFPCLVFLLVVAFFCLFWFWFFCFCSFPSCCFFLLDGNCLFSKGFFRRDVYVFFLSTTYHNLQTYV